MNELPSVAEQKQALRDTPTSADRHHRVMFVGEAHEGVTDVVASMHRALEGIGHTVFTVDTRRFPQVLDRSSGASGGNAPVYLRIDLLTAALDRFAPHVLIVCGAGIALTENATEELRSRGIATIGMTLSDPDVQPSVAPTAGRFDLHTTNSALAHQGYQESGLTNTIVVPFGIDRAFILKDVLESPKDRADVVCIGHAAGRPERNKTMTKLARECDVRVYGDGWKLPSDGPVRGDAMIAAARGGSIHVNFPQTRAGHINVKCGVFESIGSGAVLCTPYFDEMAGLFEYDSEIVGYTRPVDLIQSIKRLLDNPDELELMRRRGFKRLVSEHLYEHRWNVIFEALYRQLAAQGREVAELSGPPRHVVITGYFGAHNLGDDFLLDVLADTVQSKVPNANVIVAAESATRVTFTQGLQAFDRRHNDNVAHWAARTSAVLLGPGGLWHDYSIIPGGGVNGVLRGAIMSPSHLTQLPLLAKIFGADFHVAGIGAGPLNHPEARALARYSGEMASSVIVRDEDSRGILQSIEGWNREIEVAPDFAYSLDLNYTSPARERRYMAVNVRPWGTDSTTAHKIVAAAIKVADKLGLELIGLPFMPQDEMELKAALTAAGRSEIEVISASADRDKVLSILDNAEFLMAMRLHANLVAHRFGTSALGFAYDPKVKHHFEQIGRGVHALPLDLSEDEIVDAALRCVEAPLTDGSKELIARYEAEVTKTLDGLAARVAESPVRSTTLPALRGEWWATTAAEPDGSSSNVDLSKGQFASGNLGADDADVAIRTASITTRATFNLMSRAPQRGDFGAYTLDIAVPTDKPVTIDLVFKDGYRTDPSLQGRLVTQLLVDGEGLFQTDIAATSGATQASITRESDSGTVTVEVRLVALRDCEDWGWGTAVPVSVSNVVVREAIEPPGWTTSTPVSPYTPFSQT